jgi:hypothetical protein
MAMSRSQRIEHFSKRFHSALRRRHTDMCQADKKKSSGVRRHRSTTAWLITRQNRLLLAGSGSPQRIMVLTFIFFGSFLT